MLSESKDVLARKELSASGGDDSDTVLSIFCEASAFSESVILGDSETILSVSSVATKSVESAICNFLVCNFSVLPGCRSA